MVPRASYRHDALNRVTQIQYRNNGVTDQTLVMGYDAGAFGKSRLTSASDARQALSWTYDARGRVTAKVQSIGAVPLPMAHGYTNGDLSGLIGATPPSYCIHLQSESPDCWDCC